MNNIKVEKINIGTVVNQEISLPIVSIGEGARTVGIVAGVHGNEPESLFIVRELLARLKTTNLSRRVKILAGANPFGLMYGTREAAFDALDLNRSFPGNPDGTLTQRTAYAIFEEFRACEVVVDIHSIVNHGRYMGVELVTGGPMAKRAADLNRLLNPPAIWRAIEGEKFNTTLANTLLDAGVNAAVIEVPKLEYLDEETMSNIVEGLIRIVTAKDGEVASLKKPIPIIANEKRYMSDMGGIYIPAIAPMEVVEKDQLIGTMVDLRDFKESEVKSKWGGVLTVQSSRKVVRTGDKIYVVGEKVSELT